MSEICGAKTRAGHPCKRPAGYKTDHLGQGKCFQHGGASPGAPLKHGQYAYSVQGRLGERIKHYMEDPDPLNLTREIAVLRARADFLLGQIGEVDGIPNTAETAQLLLLVKGIRRVADTISKIQTRETLTTTEMLYVIVTLSDILLEEVSDGTQLQRITDKLRNRLTLPGRSERLLISGD